LDNRQYGPARNSVYHWRFPGAGESDKDVNPGSQSLEFIATLSFGKYAHDFCQCRPRVSNMDANSNSICSFPFVRLLLSPAAIISKSFALDQFRICDYFVLWACRSITIFAEQSEK